MIPDKIFRQTAEKSNELNLTHYELITKIMVDEYDYRIIEEGDTPFGTHYWNLVKNQTTDQNMEMDEEYLIEDLPTPEDTLKRWREQTPMILEGIRKANENRKNTK